MNNLQTLLSFIVAMSIIYGVFFISYTENNRECIPYRNDAQQFNQYPIE